jgi:fermentation-respiration switch protein FrsA (DUF1100 family)
MTRMALTLASAHGHAFLFVGEPWRAAPSARGRVSAFVFAFAARVSADPGTPAAYRSPDSVEFYLQPIPPGKWENKATLRSTRWARMYEPGTWVERVSPTPLLMVVARNDAVAVTDLALKAYERALEPKRLVMISGGHFDPCVKEFAASSTAAVSWFREHLGA